MVPISEVSPAKAKIRKLPGDPAAGPTGKKQFATPLFANILNQIESPPALEDLKQDAGEGVGFMNFMEFSAAMAALAQPLDAAAAGAAAPGQ